jgi:hypothetical protein
MEYSSFVFNLIELKKYIKINVIIRIMLKFEERNLFISLLIIVISLFPLSIRVEIIKIRIILTLSFIFFAFSFGITEAKIMNIIKIPPMNKIKNIMGIHTDPVIIFTLRNIIAVFIKIKNLAFIGLLAKMVIIVSKIIKILIMLIIFLSLKKILVLETKDLEKNFFYFLVYFFFFYLYVL